MLASEAAVSWMKPQKPALGKCPLQGFEPDLHVHHDLLALSHDHNRFVNQVTEHLFHSRDPVIDLCWSRFLSDCTSTGVRVNPRTVQI